MIVGFTGTQRGMNDLQTSSLQAQLIYLEPEWGHHGMCVGGDDEFNDICHELGIRTHGHPPVNTRLMARCMVDEISDPEEYLVRNHDIVDVVDVLFVAPRTDQEVMRSGTWATYRYAQTVGRRIILLHRDL